MGGKKKRGGGEGAFFGYDIYIVFNTLSPLRSANHHFTFLNFPLWSFFFFFSLATNLVRINSEGLRFILLCAREE